MLAPPRDSPDVPSIPPVTETGKREAALGSPTGNVLFNVHIWPDGTALGSRTEVSSGTLIPTLYEGGGSANCTKCTLWYPVPQTAAGTSS